MMDVLHRVKDLAGALLEMSDPVPENVPLLDLGADSLVLIELSQRIEEDFGAQVSVQQLFEDIVTVDAIARWIEQHGPEPAAAAPEPPSHPQHSRPPAVPSVAGTGRPFRETTAESRRTAEAYQQILCNNRRIAERDDLARADSYPVWVTESDGAHLRDVDGNRLVDMAMGYGSHLFGHNPDFVVRALHEQLAKGIHLGGEVTGSGELAEKVCRLTGMERVNFCVTGTEAVFTAIRLARAFTRRSKVLILNGAYHGHSDATLYGRKPGARSELAATPSVPGVSASGAEDVLVASPDDEGLTDFLTSHGDEIAAVLLSPLDNGHPDRDLSAFARRMRETTRDIGALLVFDEVLTGFRTAPGGCQESFGVTADLATYGKTMAGGLPIAAVAGRAEIMDLVDGGPWTENLRVPGDSTTFTGGTYTKHPLSVAAANAVLGEVLERGTGFLSELAERGERLRGQLSEVLDATDSGVRVIGQGSVLRFVHAGGSFAFTGGRFHEFRQALLAEGVYIVETGLSFVSATHSDHDLEFVVDAVGRAADRCSRKDTSPETTAASPGAGTAREDGLAVSVSFFGMLDSAHGDRFYDRVVQLSEAAEEGGLDAVWFPERHFDSFAGFSPNPAVLAALVAARTSRIGLRAGSAVLPLHSPVSVAEEWAMLDVASGGRVGIAVAPGWMRRDFVLSEGSYDSRRELLAQRVDELSRLWAGEKIRVQGPGGEASEVALFPRPVQAELPLWQATLGNERSFHTAGKAGRNILTNLIQQDLDELEVKLRSYRQGRREAGLDPEAGEVTVLVHTAFAPDAASEGRIREDLERYMLQTFKSTHPDPGSVADGVWNERMSQAAGRLRDGLCLIGGHTEWLEQCRRIREAGATEISCMVDFASDPGTWETTVRELGALRETVNTLPVAVEARPHAMRPGVESAPEPRERRVDLTRGAVEMWAASKLSADARDAYTVQRLFELRGRVDLERLQEAFVDVLRADPALRLRILPTGDAGVVEDFSEEHRNAFVLRPGVAGTAEEFQAWVDDDLQRSPAEPERCPAPVLRCQRSEHGAFLHLAVSHAVVDGQGFSRIVEQMGRAYAGESVTVPKVHPDRGDRDQDQEYWGGVLKQLPAQVRERSLAGRSVDRDWRGRRYSRALPEGWLAALERAAHDHGVTSFVESLATAVRTLDAETGTPLLHSFPTARGSSERFGSAAHLIPVWGGGTVDDVRERCGAAVFGALEHGSLTFSQIMGAAEGGGPARGSAGPDVTFAWDHFRDVRFDDAEVQEISRPTRVVRFPLGVTVTAGPSREVTLSLDVGADWIDEGERLFEALYSALRDTYGPAQEADGPVGSSADLPEAIAATAEAVRAGSLENSIGTLRLDERTPTVGLLAEKVRSSAAAMLDRCAEQRPVQVRVSAESAYDLLLSALVCAVCGLADRAVPASEPAAADGQLVELRPSSIGAESADGVHVVGLSAWTYVDADAELPSRTSSAQDIKVMFKRLAQVHPPERLREAETAFERLADVLRPATAGADAETVAMVRSAWGMALGRTDLGDDQDFFACGGDSIAAIRVMAAVNDGFGLNLPATLVYSHPTVSELACELAGSSSPAQ